MASRSSRRRLLTICLFCSALLAAAAPAVAQSNCDDAAVDALIEQAVAHDPDLQALYTRWRSTLLASDAALHSAPPLRLSWTWYVAALETRQGPIRQQVSISQAIPIGAARRAAAEPGRAEAEAIAARFDATVWALRRQVRTTLFERAAALRIADRLVEQRDLLGDLMTQLEAVLAHGFGSYGALPRIAAQLEIADANAGRQRRRAEEQALRIAALTGNHAADLPTPCALAPDLPDADEIESAVRTRHPLIEANDSMAAADRARARAARTDGLPVPSFHAAWTQVDRYDRDIDEGGRDAVTVGAAVAIPLFRRQFNGRAEAFETRAGAWIGDSEALVDDAVDEALRAKARVIESTERAHRLTDTIRPLAADAAELQADEAAQGEGSYLEALASWLELAAFDIEIIELQRAVAVDLETIDALTFGLISGSDDAALPGHSLADTQRPGVHR